MNAGMVSAPKLHLVSRDIDGDDRAEMDAGDGLVVTDREARGDGTVDKLRIVLKEFREKFGVFSVGELSEEQSCQLL